MIWQDLVRTALIGTDKATPSVSTLEELQKLGIPSDEVSEAVLEGAGVLAILRKGAFPLPSFECEKWTISEDEENPVCSSKSAQHLKEILRGAYRTAFPEFLFHVKKNKKILPPEYLPEIFHLFRGDRQLQPVVSAVMGNRGTWLCQINSDWAHFSNKILPLDVYFTPLSTKDTLSNAQSIIELLKSYSFMWSDDRKLNLELKNFAFHADIDLVENLEALFEKNLPSQWLNKVHEILIIMHFRKKMTDEL
jgi:Family of unknown function (DUF5691)